MSRKVIVVELLAKLKEKNGRNIFIDGGAFVVNKLLEYGLIDELYLSYIPVLLGDGIRLFKQGNPLQNLELQIVKTFETGLVQLHYRFIKE